MAGTDMSRPRTSTNSLFLDSDEEEFVVELSDNENVEEKKREPIVRRSRRRKNGFSISEEEKNGREQHAEDKEYRNVNTSVTTLRRSRSAVEAEIELMQAAAARTRGIVSPRKSDPGNRRDLLTRQTSMCRMRMLACNQSRRQECIRTRRRRPSGRSCDEGDRDSTPGLRNRRSLCLDDNNDEIEEVSDNMALNRPRLSISENGKFPIEQEESPEDDNGDNTHSEDHSSSSVGSSSFSPEKPRRRLVRRHVPLPPSEDESLEVTESTQSESLEDL